MGLILSNSTELKNVSPPVYYKRKSLKSLATLSLPEERDGLIQPGVFEGN